MDLLSQVVDVGNTGLLLAVQYKAIAPEESLPELPAFMAEETGSLQINMSPDSLCWSKIGSLKIFFSPLKKVQ